MSRKNRQNADQSKSEQPADVQNEQGSETSTIPTIPANGRAVTSENVENATATSAEREPTAEEVASADQPIKPNEVAVEGENRSLTDDELRDLSTQTGLPIVGRPDLSATQAPATQPDGQPPVESPDPHGSRDQNQPFSDELQNTPASVPADVAGSDDVQNLLAVEKSLASVEQPSNERKEALIHVRYALEMLRSEQKQAE